MAEHGMEAGAAESSHHKQEREIPTRNRLNLLMPQRPRPVAHLLQTIPATQPQDFTTGA